MKYFAYGSNLHKGQMFARCPGAEPLGRAELRDFALVFRHVADVLPVESERVCGAVYEITEGCEAALDRYEGFPHLYRKEHVEIAGFGRVMFYAMNTGALASPGAGYLNTIRQGFRDWRLPIGDLEAAAIRMRTYEGATVRDWPKNRPFRSMSEVTGRGPYARKGVA